MYLYARKGVGLLRILLIAQHLFHDRLEGFGLRPRRGRSSNRPRGICGRRGFERGARRALRLYAAWLSFARWTMAIPASTAIPPTICAAVSDSPRSGTASRAVSTGWPRSVGETTEAGRWPRA